jgi:hypothetical protein
MTTAASHVSGLMLQADSKRTDSRRKTEQTYKISPRVSSELSKAIKDTNADDASVASLAGISDHVDLVARARAGKLQHLSEAEHQAYGFMCACFSINRDD